MFKQRPSRAVDLVGRCVSYMLGIASRQVSKRYQLSCHDEQRYRLWHLPLHSTTEHVPTIPHDCTFHVLHLCSMMTKMDLHMILFDPRSPSFGMISLASYVCFLDRHRFPFFDFDLKSMHTSTFRVLGGCVSVENFIVRALLQAVKRCKRLA